MPTQPWIDAPESRPATPPVVAAPGPGAPLEPMIGRQPRTQGRAAFSGRYALPQPSGRRFAATDLAAALLAVFLLLAPLAMAAWHAHT